MSDRSDNNIRQSGEKVEYTPEMIEEYIKCKTDIIYFAENYFYIVTLDYGKQLIVLRDYQKKILKAMTETPDGKRHICILSSRQSGKTTTNNIYLLHYSLFNEDKKISILANKESTAIGILKSVKLAYENLPKFLQQGISRGGWNKKTIEFENGAILTAGSTSSSAGRSTSANLLLLDEFAFVPENIADYFMGAVYPIIVAGNTAKIIIVSCVTKDTYIFTDRGIRQMKDFIMPKNKKGYRVPEYQVQGKAGINTGNILFNNGIAKTNILKTTSSMLECSEEHKLWACKNGEYGWYKSKELTTDDYISIKYGMNSWGNNDSLCFASKLIWRRKTNLDIRKITPDLAYFFGLFIAEGYARKILHNGKVRGAQITITCGDDISGIFEKIGVTYEKYDDFHYTINSLSLLELIEQVGFDITKKAKNKTIPTRLLEMSKENIVAMLQGLFDGDGYSRKDRGCIGYSSTSKELTLQVRMILLNLGVLTDYQIHITPPTKKVKVTSICHIISVNRSNSLLFYKLIGFDIPRKNIKQLQITKLKIDRPNGKDIIPHSKSILKKYIWRNKPLKLWAGVNNKKSSHFSRDHLLKIKNSILSEYPDNKYLSDLLENVQPDIKWEKINSIEKSKNAVYDFSLPDKPNDNWCHSVLYNGIIGHQTPNGMNHFHDIYKCACLPKEDPRANTFFPIYIGWRDVPGRNDQWKENVVRDIGMMRFLQEFDCQFLGSTATLIDGQKIGKLITKDPIELRENGCLSIYEQPIKGATYIIGGDPSKGLGQDYAVMQILRVDGLEKLEQVAVYRNNKIDPHNFAKALIEMSKLYNRAALLIENNGKEGGMVIEAIHWTFQYDRLISMSETDLGITSNVKVKFVANLNLRRYIDNNFIIIHNKQTVVELGKYEEVRSNIFKAKDKHDHDDCVTALIWAIYFKELLPLLGFTFDPITKLITSGNFADTKYESDGYPVAIIDDGSEFAEQYIDEEGVVWR